MEVNDYIFITLVLIGLSIVGYLLTVTNGNKQKKSIKTVKEENMEVVKESYSSTIEIQRGQIELVSEENKSLKRRLAKEIGLNYVRNDPTETIKDIKITEKNLQEHYEIDMLSGLKLIESMNLPLLKNMDKSKLPDMLNNPIVKSAVWSYIKKNKDEMIELGVIIPKGQMVENAIKDSKQETKQEENPSGMMELEMNNENSKYMA